MKFTLKLSLKSKILLWFGIIILISFVLYGFLIYFVYQFNLRGEYYERALKEHPGVDQSLVDKIKELNKPEFNRPPMPPSITILPPGLFIRIFFTITGGVLAIIIISAAGGFLFLRRMLNQVDFITRNVKEINDKKLHIRLNMKGKDPISNMAKTFDNMLDQIEQSFKNQKQFIQNVSHELNTPLTVIKTKIDVLNQRKSITLKDYSNTINLIDNEVMRLSKITQELLVLSDIENNGFKEEPVRINLKSEIERVLKLFENSLNLRKLKVTSKIEGKTDIFANLVQIEQLIFILIDNAAKYSPENEEIKINLSNDKDFKYLYFEIANKTNILKNEDIPNIFERFYKKDSSKQGKKGFGLGLSIAKMITEKNNGHIEVNYNKSLKEVKFKITFPLSMI